MTPAETLGIYAEAAPRYWHKGWSGALPLPARRKQPPPEGYTGYTALTPSWPDIWEWCEQRPDANIGLHLKDSVIGIDVDDYHGKTGGATLEHAQRIWGALPATYRSSARFDTDTVSGIRYYRVPAGTRLRTKIDFPDLAIGHIEIVQASHRYAVAPPSIHPEGMTYRWLAPDDCWYDDYPAVDDLPALPDAWVQALAAGPDAALAEVDVAAVLAALPDGPMDPAVTMRLERALADLAPGAHASRHDVTTGHVLGLLRLAERGNVGVPEALRRLASAFVDIVGADRGEQAARAEFTRMVAGERGHQLIAASPTIDIERIAGVARQHTPGAPQPPQHQPAPPEPPPTPPAPATAGDDPFWDARHSLRTIRQWAYSRMCSPWAVLGAVMARALTAVPPWITLPPLIGGRGSLNLFVALVGASGQGKGAAESVAAEAMPVPVHLAPLGSGEGLAHQYAHYERRELIRDRHACLFSEPEIDTLTALGARTGSTLNSKLRNVFSGEEIGFGYADATKRITLGRHDYRACLILGVQPGRAAALLADAAGGTPQRFVWLPATDAAVSIDRPATPAPLPIPPAFGSYARCMGVPAEAESTVLSAHVARARGDGGALDGHALFVRLKVAAALAVLDERVDMSREDWALSAAVMAVSDATRTAMTEMMRAAQAAEDAERGASQGRQRAAADAVAAEKTVERVAEWIVRKLKESGGQRMWGPLHHRLPSRDREYFEHALLALAEAGRLEITSDKLLRLR